MPNVMKAFAACLLLTSSCLIAAPKVSLVADPEPHRATRHGLAKLRLALEAKGIQVEQAPGVFNASGDLLVHLKLGRGAFPESSAPDKPESFSIHKGTFGSPPRERPLLIVGGMDDRGLMYALLEIADRVAWATNASEPFSEVRDTTEQPDVSDRALSIYTFHRATFEQRFFDEAYWAKYFDMLARDRFNSFVLIFGYENGGYFAPAYPWFFNVEGFPGVAVPNVTSEQQERNLRALNRLVEMAHDRGLRFSVGLWDHIYRGGVQSGGMTEADPNQPGPDRVWGLSQTNLLAYSRAGLAKFLKQVPGIDGIQFRMHDESGLKPGQEQHEFWKAIFQVVKAERPALPLTLRAKGLPDEIIDLSLDLGLNVRVSTKYWMEQVGLPFHPTHIPKPNQLDRRHGYADLLRYPQRYQMHWRLWSAGTMRVLLWGDPAFARRFAESTHLYDGDGFEVTEPLGTKMQAQPHDQKPFDLLRPEHRYYDYEFERYWHFYQVFGRLAYNPHTPAEVWQREFVRRFGPDAAPHIEKALHRASGILPRITASVFPYRLFPTTRGWAEKQRWLDLPEYAKTVEGSDTEQFQGIDEAARHLLEGTESAKLPPWKTALWFEQVSRDVLDNVREAEKCIGTHRSKEFDSTMVDLKILGYLARYHSDRIHAGLAYASFTRSQDVENLDIAIHREQRAVGAWELMVQAAGDFYPADLMMGRRHIDLCGHWRDELAALQNGLAALEEQRRQFQPRAEGLSIAHSPLRKVWSTNGTGITATVSGPDPLKVVKVIWHIGKDSTEIPMISSGPFHFHARIPPNKLREGVSYSIVAEDTKGRRAVYPAGTESKRIPILFTPDQTPPACEHTPVSLARAGQSLRVTARVSDPSGIKWVRLRYRGVSQFQDYETLSMQRVGTSDEYETMVPGDKIISKWDFMYFFEVMDNAGNGKIYPDFEKETPYVVVKLQR